MKKCRPVVKGPSGGTLLFCSALPARGASRVCHGVRPEEAKLCLGAACTGCICSGSGGKDGTGILCLGAACTGCIAAYDDYRKDYKRFASALPARGASAKADKLRHTIL